MERRGDRERNLTFLAPSHIYFTDGYTYKIDIHKSDGCGQPPSEAGL